VDIFSPGGHLQGRSLSGVLANGFGSSTVEARDDLAPEGRRRAQSGPRYVESVFVEIGRKVQSPK
jgi:hypothetical protein